MNNERRKRIDALLEKLSSISTDIDILLDEEQEAFDNLPESLQDGERGQKMTEAVDQLEEAKGELEDVVAQLEGAKE